MSDVNLHLTYWKKKIMSLS